MPPPCKWVGQEGLGRMRICERKAVSSLLETLSRKHFQKMNAWVMLSTCRMPSTSVLCCAGRGRYTYLACLQPSGQKHRHTNTHRTDEPQEPHGVYSGWQNLRRSVGFSLKQDLKNHALILGATRYKLRPMESSMAWVW